MRATVAIALAVAAVLMSAVVARAQWDPSATADLGAGYGALALSQSVLSNTRDGGSGGASKPKRRKKPRKATARQLRALRFAPDPAITQANHARLAEMLLAACPPERTGCPTNHAQIIAERLPTGQFLGEFGKNVKQLLHGSRNNVADAVSGFVLLSWVTQRAEPGRPDSLTAAETAGARRFLRDTRDALARSRKMRRIPDAKKQQFAEMLGNVAQHGINLQRTYLELGYPATADEVSAYLRDLTEDWLGIDVADLRLTRRGFVHD
jgi:hypothetical protein